ncbi:hypothetical protein [Spirosoma jeollabukense]
MEAIMDQCLPLIQDELLTSKFPSWSLFTLMRWAYEFAGSKSKLKELTSSRFKTLFNGITEVSDEHVGRFFKEDKTFKPFQILYSQQFYLQRNVYTSDILSQLKLFCTLNGNYDIEQAFKKKAGLTIQEFIRIVYVINLVYISESSIKHKYIFRNRLLPELLHVLREYTSEKAVESFFDLLTVNFSSKDKRSISTKTEIRNLEIQPLGLSFFTRFPFLFYKGNCYLVNHGLLKYVLDYYIYDFLRDEDFTTEFGGRIEKYIELSLKDLNIVFKNETSLRKILGKGSNVVDFYLENENIFFECKATELQPYAAVNPTDTILFKSLKESLLKAYFKQLQTAARNLSPNTEAWGVILTYKELFWSDFRDLYQVGITQYGDIVGYNPLPPENVFIVDLYTWNRVLYILKHSNVSLQTILKKAKENNSHTSTEKLLFSMHLESFSIQSSDIEVELTFLKDEQAIIDL